MTKYLKIIALVGVSYLAGCASVLLRYGEPAYSIGDHLFRKVDGVEVYVTAIQIEPEVEGRNYPVVHYKVDNGAAVVWMDEESLTKWPLDRIIK